MPPQAMPVSSLRARKKLRQREALLRAAADLFRERGYEPTRMDDIAAQAEVSTKTIYNYFTTKQHILVELLADDRMKLQSSYERVIASPPEDIAEAFVALMRADVGDVASPEDKRLWRELMAARIRNHDRDRDEFEQNRRVFTRYIQRLLQHFVRRGVVSSTISMPVGVEIIYAIHAHAFREYCAIESRTPRQLERLCRRQLRQLFDGWRPDRAGAGSGRKRAIASSRPSAAPAIAEKQAL